jgi:hypothetical protein
MPKISVVFRTPSTEPPTLGYLVSYRRVGVDASPTFLAVNPAPYPDLTDPANPIATIDVDNLLGGYQYQITVQPQCSQTSVGSLLTFTKVLPLTLVTGRDPSSSAAACTATKNITLYSPTVSVAAGVQLYTTPNVDSVGAVTLNVLGWYSDGIKAYNVNSSGIITSVVNCA